MNILPPTTRALLLINAAAFALMAFSSPAFFAAFAIWPIGAGFAPWQLLSYGFMHGSLAHLLLNMFGVFMFGSDLERVWGAQRYLVYFIVCVVSAGIAQVIILLVTGGIHPTIGASGGLFGLLLAFAMTFPHRTILLLFPPIPMPAWLFVSLYGALELILGVTGSTAGIAHFAHLGGMLGGYFLLRYWKGPYKR